jgi:hypothetical protein
VPIFHPPRRIPDNQLPAEATRTCAVCRVAKGLRHFSPGAVACRDCLRARPITLLYAPRPG